MSTAERNGNQYLQNRSSHPAAPPLSPLASPQKAPTQKACFGEGQRPFAIEQISAAELDQGDYSVNYVIENILVEGQPCIVAGKQKTLKTSSLIDMAVALATAGKYLGHFRVNAAQRVGLISGESGLATIQETFRRICRANGKELRDLSSVFISDTIPRLDNRVHQDALRRFVIENDIQVLMLDPAYMMISGADAGNLFHMGERLAVLNEIAAERGTTVVLAHHLKKGREFDRFSPPELEEIAWAGFAEFARQWILLGRRSAFEDGTGHHDLWLRAGGSAGHSGLWGVDVDEGVQSNPGGRHWEVRVRPGSELERERAVKRVAEKQAKQVAEDREGREHIQLVLRPLPNGAGMFCAGIASATKMGEQRAKRLLSEMVADGIAEECEAKVSPNHKTAKPGAFRLRAPPPLDHSSTPPVPLHRTTE